MYQVYQVLIDDTIEGISKKFGITKDEFMKINGFGSDFVLEPYMQLVVPKSDDTNYFYYTVKKGDSLYNIAKEYNVDYQMIILLNGLDKDDYIYPNQTLLIPKDNVNLYMTKKNDTIRSVLEKAGEDFGQLVDDNDDIYLREDQIIVFKRK